MAFNITKIISYLPFFLRRHKLVKLLLFIFPNSKVQLINFNHNSKLYADISDPNPRKYLLESRFYPEFFSISIPFMQNGGVFFDVGANWGFCSFGMIGEYNIAEQKNNITIHIFEANNNICKMLSKSSVLYPDEDIYINNCCVTNQEGISKLAISKRQSGESFISNSGEQIVKNLVLDTYIIANCIKKVSFMKIDIEGWEPLALEGAMNSLKNGLVDAIYTEFVDSHLHRSGFDLVSYGELLLQAGFHLFYCHKSELQSSFSNQLDIFDIDINGYILKIAYFDIKNIPSLMFTGTRNILAIHEKSGYLNK